MSEIYRDRTDGVAAKRQELLRRRRDELALMPHAIRRVVVARTARIAASVAIATTGFVFLVTAASPGIANWFARVLPGIQPAARSTLLAGMWLAGLVAYAVSRARSEHRFAVAMSRYVLPGTDLDHDVERLDHERPDEMAREMAHRLEVRSAALPVLAAAVIVPGTLVYAVRIIQTRGWPVMSAFEATLATHAGMLIAIAVAGLVGGLVMTRRTARAPKAATALGMLAMIGSPFALATVNSHRLMASGIVAMVVLLTGVGAYIVRRLRIERELIDAEDPAAGSELFTLRGVLRQIRTAVVTVGKALTLPKIVRRPAMRIVAPAVVVIAAWTTFAGRGESPKITIAAPSVVVAPSQIAPKLPSQSIAQRTGDGRLTVDVELVGETPVDIAIPGMDFVPPGWRANVLIDEADVPADLSITPFPNDPTVPTAHPDALGMHTTEVCDNRIQPLSLHVLTHAPGRTRITLTVEVQMSLAHCK